jgi:hypothetical protein
MLILISCVATMLKRCASNFSIHGIAAMLGNSTRHGSRDSYKMRQSCCANSNTKKNTVCGTDAVLLTTHGTLIS